MRGTACVLLSNLLFTAASASFKVREEHKTAFLGEDIHLEIPGGPAGRVVFRPRGNASAEVPLLWAGRVLQPRARLNSHGHLVLDDVREEDRGVYVVHGEDGEALRRLVLDVKDCAVEDVVKYGDTYYIRLNQVSGPVSLEWRPVWAPRGNASEPSRAPAALLFRHTLVLADAYAGRLSVTERAVELRSVGVADEGSFTVRDAQGKVRRRNCLHVREHQDFLRPSEGADVTVNLYLQHHRVNVLYRPKRGDGGRQRTLLEGGVPVSPPDPQLARRLSAQGSRMLIRKVRRSDEGVFEITDLAGFPVAHVYVDVVDSELPPLTLAVLSLLSLLALMVSVCLLSCLYKVHQRKEKKKKLLLLAEAAQRADKGDGQAFRQVVQQAYSRFTEESLTASLAAAAECHKAGQDTQVAVKDLETSKVYPDLHVLEMSDSGVDSGLPLDSDTDAAVTCASRQPLLDAGSSPSPAPEDRREAPVAEADGDARPTAGDETAAEDGELNEDA
ncbi:uncharacterized protein LOC144214861 [Stigmatopora nigra]